MSTGAPTDAGGDLPIDDDRRRDDRRDDHVRLADYPIPQLRKALLTAGLLLAILGLFVYMIHEVIVALIVGVVLAIYLLPAGSGSLAPDEPFPNPVACVRYF